MGGVRQILPYAAGGEEPTPQKPLVPQAVRYSFGKLAKKVLYKALIAAEKQLDDAAKKGGTPMAAKDLSTLVRTCYVIAEREGVKLRRTLPPAKRTSLPDPWSDKTPGAMTMESDEPDEEAEELDGDA